MSNSDRGGTLPAPVLSCVHGIFQARTQEWVAIPFSKGWALGCVHLNERMSSPNFHKGAQWAGRGSAGNVQGTSQRVGARSRWVSVRRTHPDLLSSVLQ